MPALSRKTIENPLPVAELLARAEQGDADCQYWAAVRYFQADGVPEDRKRAVDLCSRAAGQGNARARAFLAFCYFNGIVLPRDLYNSAKLYRLAAEQGYAPAQHSLGVCYLRGMGVRKSLRQALRWLEKAAAQGDADALVQLGRLFQSGNEVVQDEERACRCFGKAAAAGHPAGQLSLGGMLMEGSGTPRDLAVGMELIDLAAAQGYQPALQARAHLDEFVGFDPAKAGYRDFPVDHPFPVRRRTALLIDDLGRPCCHALASDLYAYLQAHPQDEDPALKDIAALLAAAAGEGEGFLPLVTPPTPG